MIYQTDSEFEPDIQHYGCYYLSLLWQLNRLFGNPELDHKVIELIYNTEKTGDANHNGIVDMGDECYLEDPQGLCDFVAPGRVEFLGKSNAEREISDGEFAIQCWYNPNTEFSHFVAELDGVVGYDPIEGGSRTVREGAIDSKRIFRIL